MARFVIFTNTNWSEAPRIRHQLTRLLLKNKHAVSFFEKPRFLFRTSAPDFTTSESDLLLVQIKQLINHQLRVIPIFHWFNSVIVKHYIRQRLKRGLYDSQTVVINFAYDYFFLRDLFPNNKIITIINDDFEALSRFPFHQHITWALRSTCKMSDAVFCVSTPLQKRLQNWCRPELFLPWAVSPYQVPSVDVTKKNILLFWGSIDNFLDLEMVMKLSDSLSTYHPEWKLFLVGPAEHPENRPIIAKHLEPYTNIHIFDSTPLNDLPIDQTLAAIIPYSRSPAADAVTLANKSMQLLARGLPLIISGMPAFIEKPFVKRLDGEETIEQVLGFCLNNFNAMQPEIKKFIDENSPESRLKQLGLVDDKQSSV